jgi:hypothetical protein
MEQMERESIATAAGVDKLKPLANISWIDQYAHRYGMRPEDVEKVRFDNFIPFVYLWKEQGEYQERYQLKSKELRGDSI